MKGGYHLVCGPGAGGRSALIGQHVSAPMHISKPWWEDRLLIVNAVNSTAGLFSGDVIESSIEVKSGGELLVTSASASRAHRMTSGRAAVRQDIRVADGGWLELWPSLFIPQAGSHYSQETAIRLESGARFLWFETVAPGRVASGEAWEFTRFESRFELSYGSRPLARETYSLTPDCPSVRAIRGVFSNACHATCYAAGADFGEEILRAISSLHGPECWVGCTRLDGPAVAVRVVAADNLQLSKVLTNIRDLLHRGFSRRVPAVRRL